MKPWIAALAALTLFTACNRPDEGITDLETFTVVRDHKEGRLTYDTNPPTGGIHNAAWQNCGIYDQQIALENAVHSLEHGAVWLTYQLTCPRIRCRNCVNSPRDEGTPSSVRTCTAHSRNRFTPWHGGCGLGWTRRTIPDCRSSFRNT
ncbi:MAG: DUF3105 domain-containing protein [Pleurocapsa sp. SU_196_0]|nr:DUF3105 domain-containing protein [Pleurocapsa sp. SU_196_0]